MRKILSIILIFILLFSTVSIALNVAATENAQIDDERFASEIANLVSANEAELNLPRKDSYNAKTDVNDEFETSRLIVKSKSKIDTLNAVSVVNGYDNLWILQFANSVDAAEAYKYYSSRLGIDYVEADKKVTLSASSSEEYPVKPTYDNNYISWGPEHIGIDKFNESLIKNNITTHETVVAVVDTGVDPNHPIFNGKVIPTKINTSSSGIRNDSMDDYGHGTQVAGIIADCSHSDIYIKPYKVLNFRGEGTVITVAAGINCAINDGVDVINVSIGFEEDSEVLRAAIHNAEEKGIVVVSASGNDGSETLYYPASYSSVMKITAVNNQNVLANFSTHGNGVDFAAPGVGIITSTLNGKYVEVKGTSFAAPFAASAAAAILSVHPSASPEDVEEILKINAAQVGEYQSVEKFGNGVIFIFECDGNDLHVDKTSTPYFSQQNTFYYDKIELEIFCDTPNAVIYYTTDRTVPTKNNPNAKVYDGTPLKFSQTVVLMAVAYCSDKYRSEVSTFNSIIAPIADEKDLIVDSSGKLMSYSGTKTSFTIPSSVNGIIVNSIGEEAFKNSKVTEVILPKSVNTIHNEAFYNCTYLKTVYAPNATLIGKKAFYNCDYLKNIFLGSLTSAGEYAFYNVCSRQNLLYGRTFSLALDKLTELSEGVFMNSAINEVDLGTINSFAKNAFSECSSLVSVKIENLFEIPDGAFKGSISLVDVEIKNLSYVSSGAFSTCENLKQVSLPDVYFVNSNAFENCSSLISVNLNNATTVFSNAFTGCTSLINLNLPSMQGFEETIYSSNKPQIYLPENLETFRAESLTRTIKDMFSNCRQIKNIYLNSATDVAEYTFRACHNIYFLNLESVTKLKENSLTYCTIQFIDARNLETTADLPDNSGILLSNNFYESTDKAENLTVYGTPGTFIERYSNKKGYKFVPIPLILSETPEYVTENSETVYIIAIGFNLTYQWYKNNKKSTEDGVPIEGATFNSYTFTQEDTSPFYYCVITQTDMEKVSVITTDIIIKDTTPADYTEYDKAVEEAKNIDRNIYENIHILDEALSVDVSGMYSCEQDIVDTQTQAIKSALLSLKIKSVKTITLYSSKIDLDIFENVKIVANISPSNAIYKGLEWYTNDDDVVFVSKTGNVICIGDGTAVIYAKAQNADGSIVTGSITIDCDLTTFEKIIGFLFKWIIILASYTSQLNYII